MGIQGTSSVGDKLGESAIETHAGMESGCYTKVLGGTQGPCHGRVRWDEGLGRGQGGHDKGRCDISRQYPEGIGDKASPNFTPYLYRRTPARRGLAVNPNTLPLLSRFIRCIG